ncbi:unnamed protein product [Hydatigera taeniaeformis]|uniref:Kinesin motor domain-containing protein n=1 Tax=Hydatigena taeniaeformis TaxID=6205 RepID=A0A0R3X9P5_HYDTA|nr:unnamed protein product [Hydatigera taeniaeformis]
MWSIHACQNVAFYEITFVDITDDIPPLCNSVSVGQRMMLCIFAGRLGGGKTVFMHQGFGGEVRAKRCTCDESSRRSSSEPSFLRPAWRVCALVGGSAGDDTAEGKAASPIAVGQLCVMVTVLLQSCCKWIGMSSSAYTK